MNAIAIIPARWGASRFPGKVLADLAGRPMIEHVYRKTKACSSLKEVWVATDDDRVASAVRSFGGLAVMTSPDLPSGTDRVASAAEKSGADVVVNVQGDEPLVRPEMLDALLASMEDDQGSGIATLKTHVRSDEELRNPNVVKVVSGQDGNALYFSRFPIPLSRHPETDLGHGAGIGYKHIGIYAYRRSTLMRLAALSPTVLELAEGLEQLRFLDHGFSIRVVYTRFETVGVDTPEDLEHVGRYFETGGS